MIDSVNFDGKNMPNAALTGRLTVPGPIALATHNPQKIAGLQEALKGFPFELKLAADLGCDSPLETGTTVLDNALIKARAVAAQSGYAALSDDSGFCIAVLGDLPGAAAIDWAGPDRDFDMALKRIGTLLQAAGRSDGEASFVSCIALALPDGHAVAQIGETRGRLVWPPQGATDGYFSIFALANEGRSVARMNAEDGMETGHRVAGFSHRKETVRRLFARVDLAEVAATGDGPR